MKSLDLCADGEGSGRSGGNRDGGNSYEDDNPYDGEREDSDQETSQGGGGGGRRYYDHESSNSSTIPSTAANPKPLSGANAVVEKKSVTKSSVVHSQPKMATTAAPAPTVGAKKIDMGAAASFGKSDKFGINSPTHTAGPTTDYQQQGDLIGTTDGGDGFGNNNNNDDDDDLFKSIAPATRTTKPAAGVASDDFGDFSSAFGQPAATFSSSTTTNSNIDEFADFSSAFVGTPGSPSAAVLPVQPQQQQENILFLSNPSPLLMAPTNNDGVHTMDGGASSRPDLLADFGDMSLNRTSSGELIFLIPNCMVTGSALSIAAASD